MRSTLCIFVLLVDLWVAGCHVGLRSQWSTATSSMADASGSGIASAVEWEPQGDGGSGAPIHEPALHPGIFALFLILVSTLALLGLPPKSAARRGSDELPLPGQGDRPS